LENSFNTFGRKIDIRALQNRQTLAMELSVDQLQDERCAREKLDVLKKFLRSDFVHLDVTTEVFSPHETGAIPRDGWRSVALRA